MSDKSFGDHISRGIVKNPLLSTAVTGLSIEDLTQNAVLLPVSRIQELIGRQDQTEPESILAHAARPPPIPSGDAAFTPIHPPNLHATQNAKNGKNDAWHRTEDDFDVNEYFARLQSTRYVSAPINLKEDSNANLAREDNLEEVNLNEPDKAQDAQSPTDAQPSLTADIAQNFSQLPTVLPQVASAVFSSFSNMLSMRSREHTLDDVRPVGPEGVALYGVSEAREVAPPPKEPPASGHGNFRITTKKKYAQVPGLSSGEAARVPSHAPPSFNQTYFTPTIDNKPHSESNITNATTNIEPNVFSSTVQSIPRDTVLETPKGDAIPQYNLESNAQAIIPPPPMFSNLAKQDSLPSAGKSLLPPSVARRIASNKPTINTQPPTFSNFDNIFVPSPIASDVQETQTWAPNSSITPSQVIAPPILAQTLPTSGLATFPSQAAPQTYTSSTATPTVPINFLSGNQQVTDVSFVQISANSTSIFNSRPPIETVENISTTTASTVPETSLTSPVKLPPPPMFTGSQSLPPSTISVNLSAPSNIPTIASSVPLSTAAPHLLNYSQTESILNPGPITSQMPAETKIPEPPKAVGNTNFRMTKKRPQYYSGPIEGIGAIGNNVKPTLNPVDTTSFQGAVFTPDITTPENVAEIQVAAPSAFQGAILTPSTAEKQDGSVHSTGYQSVKATQQGFIVPGAQYERNTQAELPQFDINKVPEPAAYNTSYNIAFDTSRQTTESYEPPKQESGFGIIGSLKSKLGSLDINKIQNSVTTFFDPAYNAAKPETAKEYETATYGHSQGIEIYVPNMGQQHVQPYNYDTYQANFTYGQGAIPNPTNFYEHQVHNVYSPQSYFTQPNYGTHSYTQGNQDQQSNEEYQGQQFYSQEGNQCTQNSNETSFDVASTGSGFTGVSETTSYVHDKKLNKKDNSNEDGQKNEEHNNTDIPIKPKEIKDTQSKTVENQPEKASTDPQEFENIEKVFETLKIHDGIETNPNSFFSNVAQGSNATGNITSPFEDESGESNIKIDTPRVLKKMDLPFYFDILGNIRENIDEPVNYDNPSISLFPASLNDVSSILATQQMFDGVCDLYENMSQESTEAQFDSQETSDRLALTDFDEDKSLEESLKSNDLNICETCREVTKPEEKGADLTSQLIENITSPIQLLNPVVVPLPESHSIPDAFDAIDQCAEISLIADETIEILQVQSASELLDDNINTNVKRDYGWRNEASFSPTDDLLDHDYTFKLKSNLFFDNMSNNASDEIKAEFKVSQDDAPLALQTQMSVPTAPPEEVFDETKSDKTGDLDVQSIEQDASNDFPVFEEFVIEPSETDDDKIRDQSDEAKDTFTNRVDRFKKLESSEDLTEQFNMQPNTMMPSYFDTGNYAVESHFRKSLPSSSSTVKSSDSNTPFRIPPGFEVVTPHEQNQSIERKVPDTSTQTRSTLTLTFSDNQTKNVITTSSAETRMSPVAHETKPEGKLPDFASVFGTTILNDKIDTVNFDTNEIDVIQPLNSAAVTIAPPSDIVKDKIQEKPVTSLPDPINFFSSATEEANTADNVNRLASYFTAPAKTESAKSFFELSQGQDHFRQTNFARGDDIDSRKPFFELSQSQDHDKEKHAANLRLMKDLTSFQNIEPSKEQVVRSVNYFTVEYDDVSLNKGEPSIKEYVKIDLNANKHKHRTEETLENDDTFMKAVYDCKYCRDCNAGPVLHVREVDFDRLGKVSFKQAMDSGGATAKEGGSAQKEGRGETTVNMRIDDVSPNGDNSNEGIVLLSENRSSRYEAVKHHWFYRVEQDGKSMWRGFSQNDSAAIENAYRSPELSESTLVPTDGGRFDVNVVGRLRIAVYWNDKPTNVRRCSWFYKGTTDARYVPYSESIAEKLEEEYRHGVTTGEWHRRLPLPNDELVVLHGPAVMVHLPQGADAFGAPSLFTFGKRVYRNPPKFKVPTDAPATIDHLLLLVHGAGEWRSQKEKLQSTTRPRVVRRGFDESEIEDPEPSSIDHLLLLCHGVGSACDMRFRSVEEVVDDFRATSLQLLQSHYKNSCDAGIVGRVEVLPISWHASLHAGPRGVDRRLARVSLASIPRLRAFTNDTVLDVLFYTSPHYCQMILDTVCSELNRVYNLFKARNPGFEGGVSLGGHSLGSVILYDLLCNQKAPLYPNLPASEKQYLSGTAAHNPTMNYPQLAFAPLAFYALGSPIAIFECIRGVESLGSEFRLPTCRHFFNIFHPYDPIAYRIEPLIDPQLQNVKPSLIPHHKGRKRMHLELKETMARVGADLKQKVVESLRSTWTSMWAAAPPDRPLQKVVEEELQEKDPNDASDDDAKEESTQTNVVAMGGLGRLNAGRRVDHVLQEAPFEMINEYLFAMTSHVCYWESEDTMLLILREIYDARGVRADHSLPQRTMTVQRDDKLPGDGTDNPSTSSDAYM